MQLLQIATGMAEGTFSASLPTRKSYDSLLISIDANSYKDTICILIAFSHDCFAYKYFGRSQSRSCPSFRGL